MTEITKTLLFCDRERKRLLRRLKKCKTPAAREEVLALLSSVNLRSTREVEALIQWNDRYVEDQRSSLI